MTIDPAKVRGSVLHEGVYEFDNTKCILYALGIGFNQDPLKREHFKFTYENEDGFTSFPTMPVLSLGEAIEKLHTIEGIPEFNPMMLLHGEQKIINYKPIPAECVVKTKAVCSDIADKGKGALLSVTITLTDQETGVKYSEGIFKFYIRGLGGFGDKGVDKEKVPACPKREPDFVSEEPTEDNIALLYRLSGDLNPLHIDPTMAAMGNFERPILHGLCTYGMASRVVYDKYCDNNPDRMAMISARFTSHVFPGETLIVETFKEGDIVHF